MRLANAVAEAYIDWGLEARVHSLNERAEFFLSQIAQVKKDLDEKEQKLLSYGREKDIVAAGLAGISIARTAKYFRRDTSTMARGVGRLESQMRGDRVCAKSVEGLVRRLRP